jgi:hypothetical protein
MSGPDDDDCTGVPIAYGCLLMFIWPLVFYGLWLLACSCEG